MANLKKRLNILESLVQKAKSFLPVRHFVLDDTDEQAKEIANIEQQGGKIRLFKVIE
ncbi:MAG: hypothetical protein Q7U66_13305 [Methylobacter sp.]|nr:hypothetical protein [Methylobacter sp.]